MAQNVVGKLPEFADDASAEKGEKEGVKVPEEKEKETPEPPEEKPASEPSEDIAPPNELELQVQKLQEERTKLLKEIKELRGSKREIKQQKLDEVQQHIDDLKDVHPEDAQLIDRVMRAKGYVTKEEANRMFYENVKQEELDKFLNKYPEYKPENDPDNIHWGSFERQIEKEKELGYSLPKNPHLIAPFLERVHQQISSKGSNDSRAIQRRVQIAGVGSGGTQQSSSPKRLDPAKRVILERGGWSEDEIRRIEEKLPE